MLILNSIGYTGKIKLKLKLNRDVPAELSDGKDLVIFSQYVCFLTDT